MKTKFRGTGTAIVTPFHKDGGLDFNSFEKLIDYQIENGVNYLVFMGTTGESVTLSKDEKNAIVNFAVETVCGRVPVVVGIGGNNTQEVVDCLKNIDLEQVDAVLSVSPYYNKPQQKGIYRHYKAVAAASPVPIIIYNVPSRTGSNITAETTLSLAHDISNIFAVKEAARDMIQCAKIIKDKPEDFLVISGDDVTALPFLSLGGDGVISVISNALPAQFSKMVNFCLTNDYVNARVIYNQMIEIISGIYEDGSPSGVKALLEIKGLCSNVVRLPLVKINKTLHNRLAILLSEIENS